MLKILQTRLQQYVNHELPDVQAGFRKGRGTREQIANIRWIMGKAREFQKNISFCFIDYAKTFVWITINCGKFWKRWEYQTTLPASWDICMLFFKETIAKHFLKARNWGNSGIQQQQKNSISDIKIMIKSDEIYVTKMEICMQVRKQQLELNMEQQTGSKLVKE